MRQKQSEEISSDTDSWTSVKYRTRSSEENFFGQKSSCSSKNDSPIKHQEYSKGTFVPKCTGNVLGLLSEEKEPCYIDRQLSKAIQSSRMQCRLQRPFEFLQSARDKRDVHTQTDTCNICVSCPGSSRNIEKSYKRQRPSIIDSYKCRGGSKIPENIKKWRKAGTGRDNSITEERKESPFVIPRTRTDK